MAKQILSSDAAPAAIGPYSQAVRAGGYIFVSGQIPLPPERGGEIPAGIRDQTRQAILNIRGILARNGSDLKDVVKTTVYMRDLAQFSDMNEVYATFFPADPPARATVEVSGLPKGALVEIEAVAWVS